MVTILPKSIERSYAVRWGGEGGDFGPQAIWNKKETLRLVKIKGVLLSATEKHKFFQKQQ